MTLAKYAVRTAPTAIAGFLIVALMMHIPGHHTWTRSAACGLVGAVLMPLVSYAGSRTGDAIMRHNQP